MEAAEEGENKKRTATGFEQEFISKRVSLEARELLVKILCPVPASGSVLGKGGAIIIQAALTSGAKIKLSQNQEYYPTTADRILLISGTKAAITIAYEEFVTRIAQYADNKPTSAVSEPAAAFEDIKNANQLPVIKGAYTVRILVPASCTGAVIGRSGSHIRALADESGCRVQLCDGSDPMETKERIVTISGSTLASITKAAMLLLAVLVQNPIQFTYANPRAIYQSQQQQQLLLQQQQQQLASYNAFAPLGSVYGQPGYCGAQPQLLQQQQQQAVGQYGQQQAAYPYTQPQRGMMMSQSSPSPAPTLTNLNAIVPPLDADITPPVYTTDGVTVTMQIGVPDVKLGALLGQRGAMIREIMGESGTTIQVSQKDQFIPDTRNRSVKVSGTIQQVYLARNIIFQRLAEGGKLPVYR